MATADKNKQKARRREAATKRKEAKAERKKAKADMSAARVRRYNAKTDTRTRNGGTGMTVVFFGRRGRRA